MTKTKISWTEYSWNPFAGCQKISPGCKNCYAEPLAYRMKYNPLAPNEYKYLTDDKGKWNGNAALISGKMNYPRMIPGAKMIFVCSMSDLFYEKVPFEWIDKVFETIRNTPKHTFQILTKRPQQMVSYYKSRNITEAIPNIWIGITVEDQERADERMEFINMIPATVKFLNAEPLLDKISIGYSLRGTLKYHAGGIKNCIDWVVAGGETGFAARPMNPNWIRLLRDESDESGIPFHFKSWGEYVPVEKIDDQYFGQDGKIYKSTSKQDLVKDLEFIKIGRNNTGRKIDGLIYDNFPEL